MSRSLLLGAASSLAVLVSQTALATGPTIIGGGAQAVSNDTGNNGLSPVVTGEFSLYPGATFIFDKSSSGAGRNAVLQNSEQCNVVNTAFGAGPAPASCGTDTTGLNPVAFGFSDAVLTSAELAYANTGGGTGGAITSATYGNLLQIPFLGTGIAIIEHEATGALNSSHIQTTTNVKLTDNDLCGIFSGLLTNWNQTSAAALLGNNPINVVYRSDSSGGTFLFTNHLAGVCTSGGNSAINFTAQSVFSKEFPSGVPAAFTPAVGFAAVQTAVSTTAFAVSYITPDYTHIIANPPPPTSGTVPFAASVALLGAPASKGLLPSLANITKALNSVDTSNPGNVNFTPPTGSNIANPTLWVPIVQTVTAGYPIVGYGAVVIPQCFDKTHATVGTNLVSFLSNHYKTASYIAVQKSFGFVGLPSLVAGTKFKNAVLVDLLSPSKSAYALASNINCKSYSGRGTGTN